MEVVADPVDLQEYQIPASPEPDPCVYFLIRDGAIVYVGQTRNLPQRIDTHRREKDFDRVLFVRVSDEQIDHIERELIKALSPELNGDFNGRPYREWPHLRINREAVAERLSLCMASDDESLPMIERPITALKDGTINIDRLTVNDNGTWTLEPQAS